MESEDRFQEALERFDAINAADPRSELVDGEERPKELVYARRMSETLNRLEAAASEPLRLAARAQHLARWEIPRSDFPDGRKGYKKWRVQLMLHHADRASEVLREVGYEQETVERVATLLRKQGIKRDPDVQTLEDVACLVFLDHYFEDFAASHDDEKLVDILRKTWRKMSDRGHEAALELDLGERATRLVERALKKWEEGRPAPSPTPRPPG